LIHAIENKKTVSGNGKAGVELTQKEVYVVAISKTGY
jgi:hypothetical protein